MGMKYTGGGIGGSLPNIPARDLTDEEVTQFGGEKILAATGLYEPIVPAKPVKKVVEEVEDGRD